MNGQPFDVFLAHNSKDKPMIREIYRLLKERGINPWLDEEEIAPGSSFQDEIEQAVGLVKTAAICIGSDGLGPWQTVELKTLISQCVKRNIKVIPVLLPGVEGIPDRLLFLSEFHAVNFRHNIADEDGIFRLIWEITGQKPQALVKANLPLNPNPLRQQEAQRQQEQQRREQAEAERKRQEAEAQRQREEAERQKQANEDDLGSEKGIDYTRLRDLLKDGQWRDADQETYEVMIRAVGKQSGDWFSTDELLNFPCTDLRTIDRLWVKYSNGKFGFSMQKKIYVECGAKLDGKYPGKKTWQEFCNRVGWRKGDSYLNYYDLKANPSFSPAGEFPMLGLVGVGGVWLGWGGGGGVSSLAQRLVNCSR